MEIWIPYISKLEEGHSFTFAASMWMLDTRINLNFDISCKDAVSAPKPTATPTGWKKKTKNKEKTGASPCSVPLSPQDILYDWNSHNPRFKKITKKKKPTALLSLTCKECNYVKLAKYFLPFYLNPVWLPWRSRRESVNGLLSWTLFLIKEKSIMESVWIITWKIITKSVKVRRVFKS